MRLLKSLAVLAALTTMGAIAAVTAQANPGASAVVLQSACYQYTVTQ